MEPKKLVVARDFSRYPAGRFKTDGPYSGELFREQFLVPEMETEGPVTIQLDGVRGFGSSFLEEAFGGLVRQGYTADAILKKFDLVSADPSIVIEIQEYVRHAGNDRS